MMMGIEILIRFRRWSGFGASLSDGDYRSWLVLDFSNGFRVVAAA